MRALLSRCHETKSIVPVLCLAGSRAARNANFSAELDDSLQSPPEGGAESTHSVT